MHGLANRAIERFVTDSYGQGAWQKLMETLDLGFDTFESMLSYDPDLTQQVITGLADQFDKSSADILEDIGTYLVTHSAQEAIRRLMRLSGQDFYDFLLSVDDLPGRVRLAVPDLTLPKLELQEQLNGNFCIQISYISEGMTGVGHLLLGLLRAMADDYGALVLLDHEDGPNGTELIVVQLLDACFAEGRDFSLGIRVA